MATKKKTQWVNPDWSRARVYTVTGIMHCFGLLCPQPLMRQGAIYTLHRSKATGLYADRPFCVACHPVRELDKGVDLYQLWKQEHGVDDQIWITEYEKAEEAALNAR